MSEVQTCSKHGLALLSMHMRIERIERQESPDQPKWWSAEAHAPYMAGEHGLIPGTCQDRDMTKSSHVNG